MTVYPIQIIEVRDASFKCEVDTAPGAPFYLPRDPKHLTWPETVAVGDVVEIEIPDWMASKHRQLVGDAAFEAAKRRR